MKEQKQYVITKRIAKHGKQVVIIIPKVLQKQIRPGILAQIKIKILEVGK